MVKIRVGSENKLHEFYSQQAAFDWVQRTQSAHQMIEVLYYEGNSLEEMNRYYFDGYRFVFENIIS